MKKLISLALVAALAVTMTACGGAAAADSGSAGQTEDAAAPAASDSGLSYQDYEASDRFVASAEAAKYDGADEWPETTWNFDCSTGDTSTWAQAGYYFNALMQESTGGKVNVAVYAGEQLTNGDQVAGIQALMDGNTLQVSLHSNLIYANFDPRFNVVSLPYIFSNYDDVDSVMNGSGGESLKGVLSEYGLKCEGIGENGFRQITNSKKPITAVSDLSDIKMRICSNDLCAEVYKEWGCDASVMNWAETYTALQQGTVDGEENPETAIASASVQDVQKYISLWNAYYDCLFFCINQNAYDQFTDAQKAVIDANAAKAVEYQKTINRENVDALVKEWRETGAMEVTDLDAIDSDSFKNSASGAKDWYISQLVSQKGMSDADAAAFVSAFAK
ncbi:MAG: DctP family TRAP transporter solute-binding subunit [Lachnospiraceae bacterium]|nr:DctP family TRAP transporter solute-binding subunit [Lachnospiraceae bacterium]